MCPFHTSPVTPNYIQPWPTDKPEIPAAAGTEVSTTNPTVVTNMGETSGTPETIGIATMTATVAEIETVVVSATTTAIAIETVTVTATATGILADTAPGQEIEEIKIADGHNHPRPMIAVTISKETAQTGAEVIEAAETTVGTTLKTTALARSTTGSTATVRMTETET